MLLEIEMVLRLLLAVVLGGVIGYQRERAGKPAGLRTHALISMGAALFTIVGIMAFSMDPRLAAGVVAGVGFLGGGAILHRHRNVEGLTTAATMWIAAAIGLAAGVGLYIIAPVTAIVTLIVLFLPHPE
jgi:putative Mg2+ transporter-C (MgtC) family protein